MVAVWTKEPAKADRRIDARTETDVTSGLFRGVFKARRCIVLSAEGSASASPARMDNRWRSPGYGRVFAGLTPRSPEPVLSSPQPPARTLLGLHDRMPVILPVHRA